MGGALLLILIGDLLIQISNCLKKVISSTSLPLFFSPPFTMSLSEITDALINRLTSVTDSYPEVLSCIALICGANVLIQRRKLAKFEKKLAKIEKLQEETKKLREDHDQLSNKLEEFIKLEKKRQKREKKARRAEHEEFTKANLDAMKELKKMMGDRLNDVEKYG